MSTRISQVKVWAAEVEDRPGALAEKLDALAAAGSNLEYVVARRRRDNPGHGVVYVTPLTDTKQLDAAAAVGFSETNHMHSLRIEGRDQPGLGARLTWVLADEGINLRGISAISFEDRSVIYLAFDSADDAAHAMRLIKPMNLG